MIVAMTPQRVIGKDGKMPWHLPADLRWFKENTLNKPVIMGHTTWQSIGKSLPQRKNIVLSRQPNLQLPDAHVVTDIDAALALANESEEVMVIGGEQIYRLFLPHAERLYLTVINAEFVGDAHFPDYTPSNWQLETRIDCSVSGMTQPLDCSFQILERQAV